MTRTKEYPDKNVAEAAIKEVLSRNGVSDEYGWLAAQIYYAVSKLSPPETMYRKRCGHCRTVFWAKRKSRKWCSNSCMFKWRNSHGKPEIVLLYRKTASNLNFLYWLAPENFEWINRLNRGSFYHSSILTSCQATLRKKLNIQNMAELHVNGDARKKFLKILHAYERDVRDGTLEVPFHTEADRWGTEDQIVVMNGEKNRYRA